MSQPGTMSQPGITSRTSSSTGTPHPSAQLTHGRRQDKGAGLDLSCISTVCADGPGDPGGQLGMGSGVQVPTVALPAAGIANPESGGEAGTGLWREWDWDPDSRS